MKRREFLQAAAFVPIAASFPASFLPLPPLEPFPASQVRPANTYQCGPGGNHGVNKEAGLHIEGIGWVPNIPWNYIRIPAGNGWPPMLKLILSMPTATQTCLWSDLQDWASPTPFKRSDGRQDYLVDGRIVTLWDFKNNRQECVEDVYPVACEIHRSKVWSSFELDLFHGEIVDRLNKNPSLFFAHMTMTP